MTGGARDRRRWVASYALSLLLHALALLAFVLLAVDLVGGSTEIATPSDVTLFERDAPPEPPASAVPVPPVSAAPVPPRAAAALAGSGAASRHAATRSGQPAELARNAGEAIGPRRPLAPASQAPEPAGALSKAPPETASAPPLAAVAVPQETAAPIAVSEPTIAPATSAPSPSPVPTLAPSPTAIPTLRPSPSPLATAAPSPSPVPTLAPSPSPVPTAVPSPHPVPTSAASPSAAPTLAPSPSAAPSRTPLPSPAPTRAVAPSPVPHPQSSSTSAAVAARSPAPAGTASAARAPADQSGALGGVARAAAPVAPKAPASAQQAGSAEQRPAQKASAGTSTSALDALNARLKRLTAGGDVDYAPHRVAMGDAQSVYDQAMRAYDARLAPPPEILRRTFGFIYQRRTTAEPDSIAYVYDTYTIGPIRMCKAWKIVEHPYVAVHEVGPVAGSAGIGGAVARPATSSDVRHDNGGAAEAQTIVFPCTEKSYTPVTPGSLATPLDRHPDLPPDAVRTRAPDTGAPAAPPPSPASSAPRDP